MEGYRYYLDFSDDLNESPADFYYLDGDDSVPFIPSQKDKSLNYVTMGLKEDLYSDQIYDTNLTKSYGIKMTLRTILRATPEESQNKVCMLKALKELHEELVQRATEE